MEFVWLGTGAQAYKMIKRIREDKKMVKKTRPRSNLAELKYVHEVAASLVKAVYDCDKGKPDPEFNWDRLNYEPVDLNTIGVEADRRKVGRCSAIVRLMLFRRIGSGPNGGHGHLRVEDNENGVGQYVNIRWPKYMAVIRGTILTKGDDWWNNLKIVKESLCREVKLPYKPIMRLLKAIHKAYGDDVLVAGHSLGATLGLIATRRLAIDKGIVLNGHFFNVPNVSFDVVGKKLATGIANGIAEGAAMIPLIGESLKSLIRCVGSTIVTEAESITRSTFEFLFPSEFEAARQNFKILQQRGYRPHLYVNPKDLICNEYIPHFEGDPPAVSNAAPLTQIFWDSESCHLVPQAYLHTNHWAKGPWEAHKLHQWFKYDLVNLRSELAG